jgi:hypothetical protein
MLVYMCFVLASALIFFSNWASFNRTRIANLDPRRSLFFRRYIVLLAPWIVADGCTLIVFVVSAIYICAYIEDARLKNGADGDYFIDTSGSTSDLAVSILIAYVMLSDLPSPPQRLMSDLLQNCARCVFSG